jgi:hypothetical protein
MFNLVILTISAATLMDSTEEQNFHVLLKLNSILYFQCFQYSCIALRVCFFLEMCILDLIKHANACN